MKGIIQYSTVLAGIALLALAVRSITKQSAFEEQAKAPPIDVLSETKTRSATDNPVKAVFSDFNPGNGKASSLQSLSGLRATLAAMPADEALRWIRSFLESGMDKETGLSFEIGSDGNLTEWPSFRTFLVDALHVIDPVAAGEISRNLLDSPTSADEWALALRNVASVDEGAKSRDFLRSKTEELILNPEWQEKPTVGYLNAFDVLVHIQAVESTPLLSTLVKRKDRRDLAHAGFLTLDRLVQQNPADLLGRLAADTSLQQSRPEMTAQQFARADLRDPAQREIVRNWLLDPARTATELNAFVSTYPNNNKFISHNLLTRESAPAGADLVAHDREVLDILRSWQNDPAFDGVKESLSLMSRRLGEFTRSEAPSVPSIQK